MFLDVAIKRYDGKLAWIRGGMNNCYGSVTLELKQGFYVLCFTLITIMTRKRYLTIKIAQLAGLYEKVGFHLLRYLMSFFGLYCLN